MVKQNTKKDSCLQLCLERKETKVIFIVSTYLLRMSGSLLSMPAHTHTHTHTHTIVHIVGMRKLQPRKMVVFNQGYRVF